MTSARACRVTCCGPHGHAGGSESNPASWTTPKLPGSDLVQKTHEPVLG